MDALLHLAGTLWEFLFLLFKVLLIAGAGFLIGYFLRKRKKGVPGAEDLEGELHHLEEAIDRAKGALDDLLRKAQRPPRAQQLGQPTFVGYRGPKLGAWVRLRKRVSDFFNGIEPQPARGETAERLARLKQTVNYIRDTIKDNVTPFVVAPEAPQPHRGGERFSTPSGGLRADIDTYQQDDTLPAVGRAAGDSQYGRTGSASHQRTASATEAHGGRHAPAGAAGRREIGAEVELYNRAVTDVSARDEFRERVQPIRVGTVNAVERSQNPNIDPEFKEASDGDLLAFAITGRGEYAVVPRLGLTIESVRYTAGALGKVFDQTQGYNPQFFYSRYRVREPAIFRRDGDRWQLLEPGELELGPGD